MVHNINTERSGSSGISDWDNIPNMLPSGTEINKRELYVLSGASLMKMYHLLSAQRYSALQMVLNTSPHDTTAVETYLSMAKYINGTMNDVLNAMKLNKLLLILNKNKKLNRSRSDEIILSESLPEDLQRVLKTLGVSNGHNINDGRANNDTPTNE
jgi:hypothetical protein